MNVNIKTTKLVNTTDSLLNIIFDPCIICYFIPQKYLNFLET